MKRYCNIFLFLLVILSACKTKQKERPTSAIETGRFFIQSSLEGSYGDCNEILLPEIPNIRRFDSIQSERNILKKPAKATPVNYIIHTFEEINDSVAIITYSYVGTKEKEKIILIKRNENWYVNLDNRFTQSL